MHPNSDGGAQSVGEPLSSGATEGESLYFILRNTFLTFLQTALCM